jgi:hypothetical protein
MIGFAQLIDDVLFHADLISRGVILKKCLLFSLSN